MDTETLQELAARLTSERVAHVEQCRTSSFRADPRRIEKLGAVASAALHELARIIGNGPHGAAGAERLTEADGTIARVCSLAVRRIIHPDT